MLRCSTRSRWLTVALMALCAIQGSLLGTLHHACCHQAHHVHAPVDVVVHAGCSGSAACSPVALPAWTGHHHSHDSSSAPHDWRNCLACRYMAERSLPLLALKLCAPAAQEECSAEAAVSVCADGAPLSYHSRASPV